MDQNLERKLQVYRVRISNLIDEHAEALVQAQELHQKLQEEQEKVKNLEKLLKEKNVQEKEPSVTIIDHDMVSAKR